MEFFTGYGYETPEEIIRWEWSSTFGRWGALVRFKDGTQVFTYPKDHSYVPPHVETPKERKESLLKILHNFMMEDFKKNWEGAEWGKVLIGNAIIDVARDAGATDDEIRQLLKNS